jgi:hypothetical protein
MKRATPYDAAALEARLGARLAAGLSARAAAVPHDISERLRVARDQALAHARLARRPAAAPAAAVVGRSGSAALLSAPSPWWLRAGSALPLIVLVAGLVAIQEWRVSEQVQAAADIDAVLLADDLPPSAYSDPGFAEFLRSPQP